MLGISGLVLPHAIRLHCYTGAENIYLKIVNWFPARGDFDLEYLILERGDDILDIGASKAGALGLDLDWNRLTEPLSLLANILVELFFLGYKLAKMLIGSLDPLAESWDNSAFF